MDVDTLTAYYCFVNLGWPPSKYDSLPFGEKQLVSAFAMRDMVNREEERKRIEAMNKKR